MNPMIRKELRQRMRERRGWILFVCTDGVWLSELFDRSEGGNLWVT